MLRLKSQKAREHLTIQLLWAATRLLVTRFYPCLPSGWVFLQGNEPVRSVQDYTLMHLCLVWIRKIWRQEEFKIPLCNPSGGSLLRQSCQASTTELLYGLNALTVSEKGSTTDLWSDSKWGSDQGCCRCGVWVKCKCMEFVAAG